MLFVDVDALKRVNDAFGHNAGDEALKEVARLLVAEVRKSDFVGRLGGDEFGILLEHADEQSACETAGRICETVAGARFFVDRTPLPLRITVGMAAIEPGDEPKAVIERADLDMYRMRKAHRPPEQLYASGGFLFALNSD
jgi:diguanylate cyclase (GGDEF)-like protein